MADETQSVDATIQPIIDSTLGITDNTGGNNNVNATLTPTQPPATSTNTIVSATPIPSQTPVVHTNTPIPENYFKVKINGEQRVYVGDSFNFINGKWTTELHNSSDTDDRFEFQFPRGIKSGEKIRIIGDTLGYVDDSYLIIYTTNTGRKFYSFGLLTGDSYTIKINIWDEENGVARGTISGEIHPYDATPLIFSEGEFVIPIHQTAY